jgi:Ca-activated chloride channel family protein
MTHTGLSRSATVAIALVFTLLLAPSGAIQAQELAQDAQRPMFTTSVAVVPITALVRDSKNRIVRNLGRSDFEVLENGRLRPIVDFNAKDNASLSVAFLFDTSGSMRLALNLEKGIWFIEHFLSQMTPVTDEAAFFTFHKTLRQEVPFTNDRELIHRALGKVNPWGLTSLYDAIAETAGRLTDRSASRRAVVVISDGIDTSSALTTEQVSALASAVDVPIYVVAVVSPIDRPGKGGSAEPNQRGGRLSDLADWTGGELAYVTVPEQASTVTRDLIAMMRQQYFMAIESATDAGWYPIEVKTKREGLSVRARRGYFADSPANSRIPGQ